MPRFLYYHSNDQIMMGPIQRFFSLQDKTFLTAEKIDLLLLFCLMDEIKLIIEKAIKNWQIKLNS